ncbi:hypothetical protein IGI04_039120 [Brassica rapa subsp. trilocularis]|uniref:XPG-I domain-containing protein n=1 Tax=Brassica rapa subsp. trilocularis TaxID=1813537 RepID=A0ABQ7LNX4_BRACM|nr:hypothetical protein IGI04_039120 [Brassica rapa subsp. trilocularis]
MGVGGKFWDLLRPIGRHEGSDYLRDKRVAVDLSFWIIQHETAVKGLALKPHLRLTFFRTINLFSKYGAYPVFVVDGTPSPLKSQTRISRFYRSSGIDTTCSLQEGVSVERNKQFCEWVSECMELLKLLGIPVLKANGEAEALCAQLNSQGFVDACITPDSDSFLFGANCVIKAIKPNSTEPFECYHMSDIEAGLGLKRRHLIAISLLVGNDFDSGGVLGIGLDKALRIVRAFSEDEILQRLEDIGKGLKPAVSGGIKSVDDDGEESSSQMKRRLPHCSRCGHPGSKRTHFKSSCEHCTSDSGCIKKPLEFICECSFCSKDRVLKEQKKSENWWIKVCDKITLGPDFPNRKIIQLYLSDIFTEEGSSMSWGFPDTEMLVDCLVFNLHWDPCYVRKMLLPMLSTIYLRERARNNNNNNKGNPLLCDQYEFHSVKCMKTRYGHKSFVIRWRKPISTSGLTPEKPIVVWEEDEEEVVEEEDCVVDGLNEPQVQDDNGECFLLTDECIGLVQSAFPEETEHFLQEKKLRDSKKKNVCEEGGAGSSSMGAQRSITDFYRSTKAAATPAENIDTGGSSVASASAEKKREASSSSFSKSVRRRLLFG